MKKRLITAALCFILLVSFSFSAMAAPLVLKKNMTGVAIAIKDAATVTLDGEKVRFEAEPVRIDSSVDSDIYVPMHLPGQPL